MWAFLHIPLQRCLFSSSFFLLDPSSAHSDLMRTVHGWMGGWMDALRGWDGMGWGGMDGAWRTGGLLAGRLMLLRHGWLNQSVSGSVGVRKEEGRKERV